MPRINQNLDDIDDEQAKSAGQWSPLPDGEYVIVLKKSDYKKTKAGDGMCLHLFWKCAEAGYGGREVRDFLVLEHPNPDTTRIARQRLKQIALAVRHKDPNNVEFSEDLEDVPVIAVVAVETTEYEGRDGTLRQGQQNRIVAYKPFPEGATLSRAPATPQPAKRSGPTPQEPSPYTDDDWIPF